MGKGAPWVLFLFFCGVLVAVSLRHPSFLSDTGNQFLRDFMDADILAVLGFITAVGNASTVSIFLHLNKLEDETEAKFVRSRVSLKQSAVSLVVVFLIAFFAVVLKPVFASSEEQHAFFNSIGVACVVFSLSVLRDLTETVFKIPTKKRVAEIFRENSERD